MANIVQITIMIAKHRIHYKLIFMTENLKTMAEIHLHVFLWDILYVP